MAATIVAPDPAMLQELSQRLEGAMSQNVAYRQESVSWLLKARNNPDLAIYLAALTVIDDPAIPVPTRQYAGLMLKDLVRTGYRSLPQAHQVAIRNHIPGGLASSIREIQMVCGDIIAAVASRDSLSSWPGLVPFLLEQAQTRGSDAAVAALVKITEDQENGPSNLDLTALVSLFSSPNLLVRRHAVSALNNALGKEDVFTLIFSGPFSRAGLYECVLDAIVPLQADKDDMIQKCLCQIYTLVYGLSSAVSEKILAHYRSAIIYIMGVHRENPNPDVAREAAEFWLNTAGSPEFLGGELTKKPEMAAFLDARFDEIVGLLLRTMRYSDEQAAEIEAAALKEAEEDVNKPVFARSRNTHSAADLEDLSDGEIDEDDEDEDDDGSWTLRKCSAAALDVMATAFPEQVAPRVTSFFQQEFDQSSWRDAEVRVLALGAIAEGCRRNMFAHIQELGAVLQPFMRHHTAAVRQITCWTLSRYASFFAEYGLDDPTHLTMFGGLLDGILGLLADNSSLVQSAATSALVTVEQRLGVALMPYVGPIASQLATCFGRYRGKGMWLLYDSVQTLAEHLGPGMAQQSVTEPLIGALTRRQSEITQDSPELLPLLETFAYIANALGTEFSPYAEQQWTYCCTLLCSLLSQLGATDVDPGTPPASSSNQFLVSLPADVLADTTDTFFDRLVVAQDVLAAIVESVPTQVTERFLPLTPGFFRMIAACLHVPSRDVRQSAHALLGDCAIYSFSLMQPVIIPFFEQLVVPQLAHDSGQLGSSPWLTPVVSNTCWMVGEIVCRQLVGLERFIPSLCESIVPLLHRHSTDSLHENAVIALGRLGFGYPRFVEQLLSSQLEIFVKKMVRVQWTTEKASAMHGFCKVLMSQNRPIEHYSIWIFFRDLMLIPDQYLTLQATDQSTVQQTCHDVLYAYKTYPPLTEAFSTFMTENFTPEEARALISRFSLG